MTDDEGYPAPVARRAPADQSGQVGVDFIDILFGIAVGEVFMGMAGASRHQVPKWGILSVALAMITFSWIGYHKAKRVSPPLKFTDLSIVQFAVDIAIVAVYFALVRHAENFTGYHLATQATLVAIAFVLYTLWDLLGMALTDPSAHDRIRKSGSWAAGFLVAAAVFAWGWEPASSAPVIVIEVAYGLALLSYRVAQERHW